MNISAPSGFVGIPTTATDLKAPPARSTTQIPVLPDEGRYASADFIFANLNGTISAWNTARHEQPLSKRRPRALSTLG